MKTKLSLLAIVALLCTIFTGCQSAKTPFEDFAFDVKTNTVPVIVATTNTLYFTNTVERIETRTNTVNNVTVIENNPVREFVVTASNIVTLQTNLHIDEVWTRSTNSVAIGETAGRIGNIIAPGMGDLIQLGIAGVLGIWGASRAKRANKMEAGAAVMAQSIETLREVLKSTPQGKEIDAKIVGLLTRDQVTAGVIAEIAHLVENTVDNAQAKMVAREILTRLPANGTI